MRRINLKDAQTYVTLGAHACTIKQLQISHLNNQFHCVLIHHSFSQPT
jgi:hypothetical protein